MPRTPADATLLIKSILVAGGIIGAILLGLTTLASIVAGLLQLPLHLGLQRALGLAGVALFIAGLGLAAWLLKYRNPLTMIVSTYFTFVKMLTHSPISKIEGRTEPLVVRGPQRYVRNPLYLSALLAFLGWAFLMDSTSSLIGVGLHLPVAKAGADSIRGAGARAIFGEQYE